jgi:hypothetical protein
VDELRNFLFLMFGPEHLDGMPDPQIDYKSFLDFVSIAVHKERRQWNPHTKKMGHWVDMKKLKKVYSQNEGCTIMKKVYYDGMPDPQADWKSLFDFVSIVIYKETDDGILVPKRWGIGSI